MASVLSTRNSSVSRHRLPAAHAPKGNSKHPWWPWLKRGLTIAFFTLVTWLLVKNARAIEWDEVWESLDRLPLAAVLLASLLAAMSHLLYSCFDLLGRFYTGHWLATRRVMAVTFISYAFNLNLGSLVGGVAFRYRLYSRLGLKSGVITRILTLSMLTNWFGYLVLAGLALAFYPLQLPAAWAMDNEALRWAGAGMLAVALAYLGMCAFSKRRTFSLRGHEIALPRLKMALLQLVMSCANWALIGGVVYVLLQQKVDYVTVLSVLLIAAVAGVITHVPAGLGVLEAVFITLLSGQVPRGELLAALLAYRAIYYIAPLAGATVLYLAMEAYARQIKRKTRGHSREPVRARLRHSHGG